MRRTVLVGMALAAATLLAGCEQRTRGTTISLGNVNYDKAFAAGRATLGQYFSIAEADPGAGLLRSSPKAVDAKPSGLLRTPPARQRATLSLRRQQGEVLADLAVEVQRQRSDVYLQRQTAESGYDTVPNKTPAEIDAAVTAEQNETWETTSRDRGLERTILDDLYKALHGEG